MSEPILPISHLQILLQMGSERGDSCTLALGDGWINFRTSREVRSLTPVHLCRICHTPFVTRHLPHAIRHAKLTILPAKLPILHTPPLFSVPSSHATAFLSSSSHTTAFLRSFFTRHCVSPFFFTYHCFSLFFFRWRASSLSYDGSSMSCSRKSSRIPTRRPPPRVEPPYSRVLYGSSQASHFCSQVVQCAHHKQNHS